MAHYFQFSGFTAQSMLFGRRISTKEYIEEHLNLLVLVHFVKMYASRATIFIFMKLSILNISKNCVSNNGVNFLVLSYIKLNGKLVALTHSMKRF